MSIVCEKELFNGSQTPQKEKQQKFRFGGFHFFYHAFVVARMDERKKAIGKNNQSITARVYKRRRRLLNKTEFFIVVEQKETAIDWRQFVVCLFHTQTLCLSFTQESLDYYYYTLLIYLFEVSCINNRNSLITFYS